MHAQGVGKSKRRTLSKAIGRDNFSMGAETEDDADDACDVVGIEAVDAAELRDVNDEVGRSEYKTSWLPTIGRETAAADMADGGGVSDANELSRALSGGTLLLGGGSMA